LRMADIRPYVVQLEGFGHINVFVQGNLERHRDTVAFLTVHDCGSSYQHWVDFVLEPSMADIRKRAVFLHVCVPGQKPDEEDLVGEFPSLDQMAINLVNVLDTLRVQQVVGLGEGAGGNILTRFGLKFPTRVTGIVAVNSVTETSQGYLKEKIKSSVRVDDNLNFLNVSLYLDAYKKRTDILAKLKEQIKFDYILVVGGKSKLYQENLKTYKQITPGLCSILKVDEVKDPIVDSPDKIAESLLLFCQGLGLMPTVGRRGSRVDSVGSTGSGRRLSMTELDTPNIRRFSLSSTQECNSCDN